MIHHIISRNPMRFRTTAHLCFLQNPSLRVRSVSDLSNRSFSIDYLINSCGLSPESASKVAQQVSIKTTSRADSVLSLLKAYGFTKPHITKFILRRPSLLLADPHRILKPKLDFFNQMGVSGPTLANILSANPNILARSLERKIIPSLKFLRTFVPDVQSFSIALTRLAWVIHGIQNIVAPNIAILQNCGVPEVNITRLVMQRPRTVSLKNTQFNSIVQQLLEMGFCPERVVFIHGLSVLSGLTKPVWEAKLAVFKSFGWSDEEILSVFKKQPTVMAGSAQKIELALDFFLNRMNWERGDIAKFPTVLALSFGKRIVPRCSVVEILISKGLIKESVGVALLVAEDKFLSKFVFQYKEEVPELLQVYQSKMGLCGMTKHSSLLHKGDQLENL